jgi:YD repeat-containing protein
MPLGPSLGTIFGVLAAIAIAIWFYLKPPSTVENISLPKYTRFEAPLELGSPRDCRSEKGCLLIYIGTDAKSVDSIPSAVELSEALIGSGVETVFAVGRDQMKECVRVARAFRRPVLLDPEGKLPESLGTHETQLWVVYDGLGNLKERTGEPMSSVGVLRKLGL